MASIYKRRGQGPYIVAYHPMPYVRTGSGSLLVEPLESGQSQTGLIED